MIHRQIDIFNELVRIQKHTCYLTARQKFAATVVFIFEILTDQSFRIVSHSFQQS